MTPIQPGQCPARRYNAAFALIAEMMPNSTEANVNQYLDLLQVDSSLSFFRSIANVDSNAAQSQAEAFFAQWGFNFTGAPTLAQSPDPRIQVSPQAAQVIKILPDMAILAPYRTLSLNIVFTRRHHAVVAAIAGAAPGIQHQPYFAVCFSDGRRLYCDFHWPKGAPSRSAIR